jgi:hypothetical protein
MDILSCVLRYTVNLCKSFIGHRPTRRVLADSQMTVGRNMGGVSNMYNVAETTPYWIFCARVNHFTHVNIYSDILRALVRRWLHSQAKSRQNFNPNCFLLLLSYLDHCVPINELRKCTSCGIMQYIFM